MKPEEPRITIKPVDIGELDQWFPLVVPAIEEVRSKNGLSATPEDVLRVLRENRGWLACTMYGDDIVGVTVLCGDGDQFAKVTDCLVWIAWTDPRNRERGIDKAVRHFTQDIIDRVAANVGFRAIRIHCPRIGWLKTAKELGYDLQEFVFVKHVGGDKKKAKSPKKMRNERILRRVHPKGAA